MQPPVPALLSWGVTTSDGVAGLRPVTRGRWLRLIGPVWLRREPFGAGSADCRAQPSGQEPRTIAMRDFLHWTSPLRCPDPPFAAASAPLSSPQANVPLQSRHSFHGQLSRDETTMGGASQDRCRLKGSRPSSSPRNGNSSVRAEGEQRYGGPAHPIRGTRSPYWLRFGIRLAG